MLLRYREWRHGRPFWGCALTLVFAVELYAATAAPMGLVVLQGVTVLGTIVVSAVLVVLAAATLAQPLLRTISGPVVVLLALVALLVSNFGGFLIGTLIGLVGGGMIFAWSPTKNAPASPADDVEPPTKDLHRHRLLSVLAWMVPTLAVAVAVTATGKPAVAQPRSGVPADLPCLIPIVCPDPTPSQEPTPSPTATAPALPIPDLPIPSLPTPEIPKAACAPEDYPTGDGPDAAALAAKILQACAGAGTPGEPVTADLPAVGIEPSVLKADRLTLENLTYRGTVRLDTGTVLKFTATKLTILGMDLEVPPTVVSDTATISGNVELYAKDLSGKAFGLVPLTFTANPPPLLPPVAIPSLFFTDVTSHVALVSADSVKSALTVEAD
ncbi:DUF6114 domain-containing protein [Cryptosporangium sp. NPDC048952]|uniref:DUF6114 domain-containing protein n=1 Tax=Cryptosporangium sp. NPDC048952 TaxID=3363961 RepID=UPI003720D15F